MRILVSTKFSKQLNKLPNHIQELAFEKEILFQSNPFSNQLRTHKLKGRLKNIWAFSVSHNYRIIFEFIDEKTALFISIGNHDIYN